MWKSHAYVFLSSLIGSAILVGAWTQFSLGRLQRLTGLKQASWRSWLTRILRTTQRHPHCLRQTAYATRALAFACSMININLIALVQCSSTCTAPVPTTCLAPNDPNNKLATHKVSKARCSAAKSDHACCCCRAQSFGDTLAGASGLQSNIAYVACASQLRCLLLAD